MDPAVRWRFFAWSLLGAALSDAGSWPLMTWRTCDDTVFR